MSMKNKMSPEEQGDEEGKGMYYKADTRLSMPRGSKDAETVFIRKSSSRKAL
jgi:hypothetical protein